MQKEEKEKVIWHLYFVCNQEQNIRTEESRGQHEIAGCHIHKQTSQPSY